MSSQISVSEVEPNQTSVRASVWVKRLGAITLIVVLMTLLLIVPQLVQAESYMASPTAQWIVNTAVDENDGSCNDGDCSLRDAIALAANGDTITFSGSYTIYLNSNLNISKRLTVDGSSRTIKISGDTGGDGSSNVRVFYIDSGSVVTLTNLSVTRGGVIGDGGGIYNLGTLTVQNCTLSNNGVSDVGTGGGIYNGGTLILQNSILSGNAAYNPSISGGGGGLYNASGGTALVQHSLFANNLISGNSNGAGIYNSGVLTLSNSTFTGNSAFALGGGIYNGGTLTMQNSTLSGNSTNNHGGGISNSGTLTVSNSTLSGNSANSFLGNGGGIHNTGTLNLFNTLIANNPNGGDCVGGSSIKDHNLIRDTANACGLSNGVNGNIVGADPLLASLNNYGGPSAGSGSGQTLHTVALLPGSPAIDAGNNAACLTTDQRGVVRPQIAACDIGAFESQGFTLAYGSGSGQSALGNRRFTDPLSLTVTSGPGEPVDGGQVVLTGPGSGAGINPAIHTVVISGSVATQTVRANATAGSYPVSADTRGRLGSAVSFNLTNLPLKMTVLGNGLMIVDGDTTPSAGDDTSFGDVIMGEATVTHTFTISNSGLSSLPITDLSLSGAATADFTLSGLTIPMTLPINSAATFQVHFAPTMLGTRAVIVTITSDDGPEYAYDFALQGVSARRLIVTNANDSGAGSLRQTIADAVDGDTIIFAGNYTIYLNSTLVITERLIIDGSGHVITVSGDSGGDGSPNVQVFYIGSNGVITLNHLNIISGTAPGDSGGGIRNWGTLTLQNSILSGNSAREGGGIYNGGSLNIQNSTLSGNSASGWGGGIDSGGTLTIQNSTLSNNSAVTYEGGGIYNWGALTMQNSTLSANSAGYPGGGIYNLGSSIIQNSTFYSNSSDLNGGGIGNEGTLTVLHSTFTGNSAVFFGSGIFSSGSSATLNLSNTLLANNGWQDCASEFGGTVGTNEHNLIEDVGSSACGLVNGVNGNLIGLNPLLASLDNYGGNTQTAALLPGSPAIDAGNACPSADQRGVVRPQLATCDIGAFESRGYTLTVAGGSGQSAPIHTLFPQPLSLTVTGSLSEPVHGGQVVLTGPGSGAGITPPIYTATISSGAVTQIVRANGTSGSYSVSADTLGRLGSAAGFNLTNLTLKTVVSGNSLVITDGDTTPSLADHTDFGNVTPGWAITRTFTISNSSGTASLIVYSLGLSGVDAGNFALSGPTLPVTLTANSAITFQVRFTPAIFATSTATITLATDDGPENDYDFGIQGTGACADRISVTNTDDVGFGSLRHVLNLVCNGGTVDFAADTTLYLNSQLEITKTLTIDGSGRTVKLSGDSLGDGTPNVRVLSIGSSGVVTLTHLTIISGTANLEVSGYEGGGIRNYGQLTLQDSTLSGNSATNYGGSLYNSGTLMVSDSTFSGNSTDYAGAGIYNSNGRITVTNSTLSGNLAEWGGGIYNASGTLTVQHSTLVGNSASSGFGGGIYNESGTLTVQHSSLSGNSGGNGGGGICNGGTLMVQASTLSGNTGYGGGGIYNGGTLTVQNSTLSGNSGDYGGGIFNYGPLTLQNSTLSGNSASQGGGIYHNSGTLSLLNTLIGNSPSGGDCRVEVGGSIGVNDHNLIQSTVVTDTCGLSNGAGGSLIGVDPQLGPLANNGGDTQTFSLLPGSPALDAGNNTTCLATDQRGVARPQGPACDIGAYEFARLSLTKSVTPTIQVLDHNTVTYTLVLGLEQGDVSIDPHIVLTDVLPSQVLFDSWVISPANTVRSGNVITWTGALAAGDAITFTFTATYLGSSNKWVTNTATFSGTTWAGGAATRFQVAHIITPTAGAGGSIAPSTSQIVDHGANITFTIMPAVGHHILDVGVDGVSVGAVTAYTFTNVTADHTISATFGLNEYALTTNVIGQGQVTRTPDQATYLHGSVVTLTALPEAGWYFGQWLGDASEFLTQTTVFMDANKVVTATFLNTPSTYYTLTLGLIGSGLITPTVGVHTYLSGTVVPLSASPEVGWQFAGWSGDVDCVDGSVTLSANKLCTATFARYQVYLPLLLK